MYTKSCPIGTARLSYRLFGQSSNPLVIVETALGASSAEWWHLAQKWSERFYVLSYDRAGYGSSSSSELPRTPANIAYELHELVETLELEKPAILIGHSLGGLYAQQYARLFPDRVRAVVLLDPASAKNRALKQKLNKREYEQSGIDKSASLKLGLVISSLKLGFLFLPLLKKAPPFYYFKGFSKEARRSILRNLTQRKLYQNAIAEYRCLESDEAIGSLAEKAGFPDVPLFLICHDPKTMTAEIEAYGGADKTTAARVDELWVSLMKEYLLFSDRSIYRQAKNSGHLIHLSDPDVVWETLCSIG